MKFTLAAGQEVLRKIMVDDDTGPITFPLYISLHTADPGQTGANEVSAVSSNGYTRPSIGNAFFNVVNRVSSNTVAIAWTLTLFARVTHIGLWNNPSLTDPSNFVLSHQLALPIWFFSGRKQRFSAGAFQVRCIGGLSDAFADTVLSWLMEGTDFTGEDNWLSLHKGAPGVTGANEADVVARLTLDGNWEASAAQVGNNFELENSVSTVFSAQENFTLAGLGLWDDESAGNFKMNGISNTPSVTSGQNVTNNSNTKAILVPYP